MATRTFTNGGVNNLWTTAGNWDTPPVDDDTVVIAAGQTCEYDGDMSNAVTWPNGINDLTITGTLKLSRTAGTYYLKIKAAKTIKGAGTFDCGASGDVIPFAAKHTVTGGAAWYIQGSGGLTMTVYAAEPAIKTVKLLNTEAIGQTVIEVDTDITSDIWADGDVIYIGNTSKIIAAGGRAAGAITITVALAAQIAAGTLLGLATRNVTLIGVGASGSICKNFASGKLTVAGGGFTTATYRGLDTCTSPTISGGSFYGSLYDLYNCDGALISGGVFGGSTYALQTTHGAAISGGTFFGHTAAINQCVGATVLGGLISNNTSAFSLCSGLFIAGGTFSNNSNYGLSLSSAIIKNATFSGNSIADLSKSQVLCFNVSLGSTTENYSYTTLAKEVYSESLDHDQSAGAFKAWTKGGVTSSQAGTVPTGYTSAMQTVLEDANNEGFWQKEALVAAGASVNITMNLRKSASMAYLPRCIVFNKALADPFAGGSGIHTFTMTDSVDTWEAETYTYSNDTANDITIVIRTQGKNASGNVFSALTVNVINVDLTTALANIAVIDGIVDAIKLKTDNLPTDPADESLLEAAIAAIPTAPTVDNILDEPVEGAYTLRQAMRIMLASLAGRATGGGTATIVFRDINNSADRITATVDINGNRSAVVLDVT